MTFNKMHSSGNTRSRMYHTQMAQQYPGTGNILKAGYSTHYPAVNVHTARCTYYSQLARQAISSQQDTDNYEQRAQL
jgi:hypothetical protein